MCFALAGHFVLTLLLMDCLLASAPARVVNVSSVSHNFAVGVDMAVTLPPISRQFTGITYYGISKACNILFTKGLQQRFGGLGITSFALNPGMIYKCTCKGANMQLYIFIRKHAAVNTYYVLPG